jgi:hypothetical protein
MLPVIDVPVFTVNLLSLDRPVRFRCFTVKEEKLFLIAAESGDAASMMSTTKQVLKNCVLDEIDIDSIPAFDIETLFMHIRARSVGEVVQLKYKCNNIVGETAEGEPKRCNHNVKMEVNLLEIQPSFGEGHEKKIQLNENVGMVLKYPNLKTMEKAQLSTDASALIGLAIDCVDYIYDKDEVFYSKDIPLAELVDWFERLQTKDLEKVRNFFDTLPRIKKDIHFHCTKCGYEEEITVEGLENFFD